ncbi:MAG: hypothetical protein U9R25_17555 [Chloroflexota bacterium]|nr:hypothetical protein [Chloroflexota bacterium]
MHNKPIPGIITLLRISVLLPIVSLLVLGLTRSWQDTSPPNLFIVLLVVLALLPAAMVFVPAVRRRLNGAWLPAALATYLICQTVITSLLHSLGLVRFDMVQLGPLFVVEPGVLLMIPLLLVAWQYGWRGALVGAALVGVLHVGIGFLMHQLAPESVPVSPVTTILRPDLLFLLPLILAYLSGLLQKQQQQQMQNESQLREYAATAEILGAKRERTRMADQLQKTLGPPLTSLGDHLEIFAAVVGSLPEATAERLRLIYQDARSDLLHTRQAISDLQPVSVEEVGLTEAIRTRAQQLADGSDFEVEVEVSDVSGSLTPEQELLLYHVTDEVLSHVVNHENVHQVRLCLTRIEGFVALTVHDDGDGCRCRQQQNTSDTLEEIQARARLAGGQLCVDAHDQGGNTLALWLPFEQNDQAL